MSTIPLITHRMLAAAAATEQRPEEPRLRTPTPWRDNVLVTLELLEEPGWDGPLNSDRVPQPSATAESEP